MTPEVDLHNFNGGNGSADIAYDAIAFVPGDYSGIPTDLTFSDPDPNAADPVPNETPNTVDGGFFPYESSAMALAASSASTGDTAACSVGKVRHLQPDRRLHPLRTQRAARRRADRIA
jgi:hypothetical protein